MLHESESNEGWETNEQDLARWESEEWVEDAQQLISWLPDLALRHAFWAHFDTTIAILHGDRDWCWDCAEDNALGQLIFNLLAAGVDIRVKQGREYENRNTCNKCHKTLRKQPPQE